MIVIKNAPNKYIFKGRKFAPTLRLHVIAFIVISNNITGEVNNLR